MELLKATEGTLFPLTRILRERAVERLKDVPFDTLVTYAELSAAMLLNVQAEARARTAVLWAGRFLLRTEHKQIVNVKLMGYRVIRPNEHVAVSQSQQRRSRRWLRRALETVTHIAIAELRPEEIGKVMTEQARVALSLACTSSLARAKVLPPPDQLNSIPRGAKLLDLLRLSPK